MSHSSGGIAEDLDDDPTHSSEAITSSCSTGTTGTSVTTSDTKSTGSTNTSSVSSDSSESEDGGARQFCRHHLCQKSLDILPGLSGIGARSSIDLGRSSQSTSKQTCDIDSTSDNLCSPRIVSNVLSSAESELRESQSRVHSELANDPSSKNHPESVQSTTERPQPDSRLSFNRLSVSSADQSQTKNKVTPCLSSSHSNSACTIDQSFASPDSDTARPSKPIPSPSPSMSVLDSNNNRNSSFHSPRESLMQLRKINFSKSASGSRLISKSRPNVCDCLSQDCSEKKHSSRRQYIENYYNSRTRLPSGATSTSSFNISTPLNKLSECDAITKRLLSSPIRAINTNESPLHRLHLDSEQLRRASLGTNSITDQIFLEPSPQDASSKSATEQIIRSSKIIKESHVKNENLPATSESDFKLKQQGRSLSVCDEDTLSTRPRVCNTNYLSNLNRAISLACETGSSPSVRRSITIIPLFGCDIESLGQFARLGSILPPVIESAVDHILSNGIDSIGIFRKSGVRSRILALRQRIESDQTQKFDDIMSNNEFSIYDVADLVKLWFRELKPLPLVTKELILLITASSSSTKSPKPEEISQNLKSSIISITTPTHRALLWRSLNFLAQISSRSEINQMSSQNLAICLTPSLCATETDQNSIKFAQRALEYCIDNHRSLLS